MGVSRRQRLARKRRRRVQAADNDLTDPQWEEIRKAWNGCCAYCGKSSDTLQKDCVQPISRGGSYTLKNVVPACPSCNASKSNSEVTSWMRRKRLDEPKFLANWVSAMRVVETEVQDPPGQ